MPISQKRDPREILDSVEAMQALDPRGMMRLTLDFPAQCREAVRIGAEFCKDKTVSRTVQNILVTGLGGSAVGGELLRCLVEEYGDVPLVVNRDYSLPGFVGKETLVIAASYSGNTEETLSAYAEARMRRARIVCITSGGELADKAQADSVPVCYIPGGQPPRASTGYLFFPMLAVIARWGLLDHVMARDVDETLSLLDTLQYRYAPETPAESNLAKQLAVALHRRVPVIYGSQGYRGVIALRWKCQFNENAKQHAFANVLPEQNHNEILAWRMARQQAPRWSVVFLRDPEEKSVAPRIARRVEVTKKIIGRTAQQHEVYAEGISLLARMFSLFYLGDFMTIYAAYLNGVDPAEIAGIDRLKAELARMSR